MASAANPFSDPLRFERRVPECVIVIFGANGDLTKRKLLPALYRLAHDRRLPESFAIIGNSRTAMTDDAFRERMCESVKEFSEDTEFDPALWDRFSRNLHYIAGDLKDPALYEKIGVKIAETNQRNVLFYLSTQPSYYEIAVSLIGGAGLNHSEEGWRRIIVEKPFGHDLQSALELNKHLQSGVPGERDLSHRSLSGQGNGPEHFRIPVWKRHL